MPIALIALSPFLQEEERRGLFSFIIAYLVSQQQFQYYRHCQKPLCTASSISRASRAYISFFFITQPLSHGHDKYAYHMSPSAHYYIMMQFRYWLSRCAFILQPPSSALRDFHLSLLFIFTAILLNTSMMPIS